MTETLEELRLQFDRLLDTKIDALTNPEIIKRGLEIEKILSEQY